MVIKPVNVRPVAEGVTRKHAQSAVDFLKQFAHTNRLLIVCSLVDRERSVGELETLLGIRQPALSQQLAELREAGIVEGRREAKQVFYRIADPRASELISMLHNQFCSGGIATPSAEQPKTALASSFGSSPAPRRRIVSSAEAARFARIELSGSSGRSGL